MKDLDRMIVEHCKNSKKLQEIYIGNDKLSFEKRKELQNQQRIEYDKMMFLKNLKKEISKNGKD